MRSLGMLISDKELEELLARLDTDGRVRREKYACVGEGGAEGRTYKSKKKTQYVRLGHKTQAKINFL